MYVDLNQDLKDLSGSQNINTIIVPFTRLQAFFSAAKKIVTRVLHCIKLF